MDYEEYMRSVLGYNQVPNNIYANSPYDNYYFDTQYINNRNNNSNDEIIESLYPEIYRIVYPMVCKACTQNSQREITRDLIDSMTDEIYYNLEPDERQTMLSNQARTVLKNGDVRNPNAKEPETRGDTRQRNMFLPDLIRILILREFLRRRPNRPPMPPTRPPRPFPPPYRPY